MADDNERLVRRRELRDRLAELVRTEKDFLERIAARERRPRPGSGAGVPASPTDPLGKRLMFLLADVRKSREAVERQLAHG
jgi:hypothetical protein